MIGSAMMRVVPWTLVMIAAGCASPARRPSPEAPRHDRRTLVYNGFRIEFGTVVKDRLADPPLNQGIVKVTILKQDPEAGSVEVKLDQSEGTRIGWVLRDGRWTSRHDVYSPKVKAVVSVDFNTELTLIEITPDQVIGSRSGTMIADEVVYETENGIPGWIHLFSDEQLTTLETLVEAARLGRRGDLDYSIEALLWRADQDWFSRNPKVRLRSRETYRRLLKVYATSEVVVANADRIRVRANSEIED